MRTISTMLCAAALTAVSAPVHATGATGTAALMSADGNQAGTVKFRDTPSGVMLVSVRAEGLPAGPHGFHIHETGQCDAAGGFKSAGGHFAAGAKHGILTEGGPHPGDLPNVIVAGDGTVDVEFFVPGLSAEGGWFGKAGLFDEDGTAVVMHSGADDYASQPSGAAGDRILCGVIEE